MDNAVGVLLRIEDPHQDIDFSRHALGDGPVRGLVGVDIGQIDQHRALAQGPVAVDAHPVADGEPVQQLSGVIRRVRDNGEGLSGRRAGTGGTGHLGAGHGVGQARLTRPCRSEKGRHRGLRRQTPTVGGLREDVPGMGEFFAQTELLTQVDGPGQVLKNQRKV